MKNADVYFLTTYGFVIPALMILFGAGLWTLADMIIKAFI